MMARPRTQLLPLCLAAALLAACATARTSSTTRELPLAARVQAPGMLFELLYTETDAAQIGRIGGGLLAAGPRLARWGTFKQGVSIRVYPDHASLEAAVSRHGYPWLRAWAFGDEVLLQSPRSWSGASAAALDEELQELLVHELTHTLMYQLIEPSDGRGLLDAPLEEPPLWFREGMASVTAGQGHRRLSAEELARWLPLHPGADVLHPPPELYRTEKEAVYGAAHRAFELLVQLAGDQAVRDVLRAVRTGARFADAFKAATGQGLAEFEREAIRSGFDATAAQFTPQRASGAGGP
jgi:hypothetical protein